MNFRDDIRDSKVSVPRIEFSDSRDVPRIRKMNSRDDIRDSNVPVPRFHFFNSRDVPRMNQGWIS